MSVPDLLERGRFDYHDYGNTSIIKNRIMKRLPSSNLGGTVNPSSEVSFNFDIGDNFIYGPSSYITGVLNIQTADSTFVNGAGTSIMNIIEEVTLRQGKVIDRCNAKNKHAHLMNIYENSQESLDTIGKASLYNTETKSADGPFRFIIKLSDLSSVFNNAETLIPSWMLAGGSLKLRLASSVNALFSAGASTYTVDSLEMVLDSVTLMDSARGYLMDLATKGLDYTFTSIHHQATPATGASVSADVGRQVGQLTKVVSAIYDSADNVIGSSTMSPEAWANADAKKHSYRYRLGGTYYPDQPISNGMEAYFAAQNAFNKLRDTNAPNGVTPVGFLANQAIMAENMERDTVNVMSGMSLLSAGRRLMLEFSTTADPLATRYINTWIHCVRVAKVYSSGKLEISE